MEDDHDLAGMADEEAAQRQAAEEAAQRQATEEAAQRRSEELFKLGQILQQTDYVLEPGALDTVKAYIRAGGSAQKCLEELSESYVGYGQMATLTCQWLAAWNKDEGEGGLASPTSRQPAQPQDEAAFLQEVVRRRFTLEDVAGVFEVNRGGPPPWLEGLISEPRGRNLMYSLSAAHSNCLLLTFAIQRILKQGHEDEVAKVGPSLGSHYSVFTRLLAARLRAALAACLPATSPGAPDAPGAALAAGAAEGRGGAGGAGGRGPMDVEPGGPGVQSGQPDATPVMEEAEEAPSVPRPGAADALRALSAELVDSCSHTAHTYLHAQQLLTTLARHPHGSVFLRLSQELESAAGAKHLAVWRTQRLLLPPGSPPQLVEAAGLVGGICDGSRPFLVGPDVLRLEQLYLKTEGLSLGPLQNTGLLDTLIKGVFVVGKPPSVEVVGAAVHLLALATSNPPAHELTPAEVDEDLAWSDEGGSSTHRQPTLLAALQAPLAPPIGWGPQVGESGAQQVQEAAARVEATRAALQDVLLLMPRINGRLGAEHWAMAQQVVAVPVAAAAMLHHMRASLSTKEWWSEHTAALVAAPGCVRLALLVAHKQPEMLQEVVAMLGDALVAVGSQRAEVVIAFSGALVVIMRDFAEAVPAVMAAIDRWAQNADISLVRQTMMQVLSSFAPPFSVKFASWLLRHCSTCGLRRKRDTTQATCELLEEFAAACQALAAGGALHLSAKEKAWLTELASRK